MSYGTVENERLDTLGAGRHRGDVPNVLEGDTFGDIGGNHQHGSTSYGNATYDGSVLFSVYDSIGGYYGQNSIACQEEPEPTRDNWLCLMG
jgi:hypothetical protein